MPSTFIADTEIDWEFNLDPEAAAQAMFQAADDLANTRRPMEIARDVLISDMQHKFNAEEGAWGRWVAWSKTYKRGGDAILNRTGQMKASALMKKSWQVTRNSIFFTVGGTTTEEGYPVGLLHDVGTTTARRRALQSKLDRHKSANTGGRFDPNTGLTSAEFDEFSSLGGRGKNLPARPWIEPTDKAKDAVEGVFIAWLDGGIRTAAGKFIPGVVRGPGGRFVGIRS